VDHLAIDASHSIPEQEQSSGTISCVEMERGLLTGSVESSVQCTALGAFRQGDLRVKG
jgi:hypothetical protein